MKKKFVSMLAAFSMLLTSVPATTFAAEFSDSADTYEYETEAGAVFGDSTEELGADFELGGGCLRRFLMKKCQICPLRKVQKSV